MDFTGTPNQVIFGGKGDGGFEPSLFMALDDMEGEGIQQFITKCEAWQWVSGESCRIGEETDLISKGVQGFPLGGLERWQGFGDDVFQRLERLSVQ